MRKKKSNLKKTLLLWMDIFFADAKQTKDRLFCLVSALFWTWLEFTFIVFFFGFAFGFAGYVLGGSYSYSLELLRENHNFVHAFTLAIVILIFITRVPLNIKKEIEKRK